MKKLIIPYETIMCNSTPTKMNLAKRFLEHLLKKTIYSDEKSVEYECPLDEVSNVLDSLNKNDLEYAPWKNYPYKPTVSFSIAYCDNCIFLKYYVEEKTIQAVYRNINDPVYKDSCVEFFIAFEKGSYYNLEFNCIGTCLAGFRKKGSKRVLLPENSIRKIKYKSSLPIDKSFYESGKWDLTLVIPIEVFIYSNLANLKEKMCDVNFYKCGDELPEPHFICWNNIETENPDFHTPQFFGQAAFI